MTKTFNVRDKLTSEDKEEIAALLGKGCRQNTKDRLRSIILYDCHSLPQHGIFDRLICDKYGWEYVAGQDYAIELATLRKLILGA